MTTDAKQYRLIGLSIKDYGPIEAIDLTFDKNGGVFALMGENESGKSSTLDALESVIAGAKGPRKDMPVRSGQAKATVIVSFDDGTVATRTWKPDGSTAIEYRRDGMKYSNTREISAALYSNIAIDPSRFALLRDADQVAELVRLIGFDPSELDAQIADATATRTDVGREVRRLQGSYDSLPEVPSGTPEAELSAARVIAERDAVRQSIAAHHEQIAEAQRVGKTRDARAADLAEAERALTAAKSALSAAVKEATQAEKLAKAASEALPSAALRDLELTDSLESIDETNAAVRAQARRQETAAALESESAKYDACTYKINAAKEAKAKAFEAAADRMPFPGITIENGAVYVDGIPLSGLSHAAKWMVGLSVGISLAPQLRAILIRDASVLDNRNLAEVDRLGKEHGYLMLTEIVGKRDDLTGVYIVDGNVAEGSR